MTPPPGRQALVDRVRAFLHTSLRGEPSEPFDTLGAAIASWQAEHGPVLRAMPPTPGFAWPAVPIGLYKDLAVGTVPPAFDGPVFRTSGTTGGGRGEHRLWSTELYDEGAWAWAHHVEPALPLDIVALLVDPGTAPDASLSHMVAAFAGRGGRVTWHLHDGRPDRASIEARIARATGPLQLATTAFALADWLDGDTTPLPSGSVVMVTGGFKGRVVRLSDAEIYADVEARTGARVVTEYGMTELSSQLWGTPATPYRPPPWLRVTAIDPATGAPRPPGVAGQLRFDDLCNVDSSVGVETLDEGIVHDDGTVTLRGRLADAEPRGCSLTVEEAWLR